jgi:hypothetical protein
MREKTNFPLILSGIVLLSPIFQSLLQHSISSYIRWCQIVLEIATWVDRYLWVSQIWPSILPVMHSIQKLRSSPLTFWWPLLSLWPPRNTPIYRERSFYQCTQLQYISQDGTGSARKIALAVISTQATAAFCQMLIMTSTAVVDPHLMLVVSHCLGIPMEF